MQISNMYTSSRQVSGGGGQSRIPFAMQMLNHILVECEVIKSLWVNIYGCVYNKTHTAIQYSVNKVYSGLKMKIWQP